MTGTNKGSYLPKVELFYLFYASLFFVVPMIHHKNIIGFVTFLSIAVFYCLTEFQHVISSSETNRNKLILDCILAVVTGALCSLVSLFFIIGVMFLFIKVYTYIRE